MALIPCKMIEENNTFLIEWMCKIQYRFYLFIYIRKSQKKETNKVQNRKENNVQERKEINQRIS